MNRRNLLKQLAGVAAGGLVIRSAVAEPDHNKLLQEQETRSMRKKELMVHGVNSRGIKWEMTYEQWLKFRGAPTPRGQEYPYRFRDIHER